jgi:hypothetical protein
MKRPQTDVIASNAICEGQSGNPLGRAPEQLWANAIREVRDGRSDEQEGCVILPVIELWNE